MRIVSPLPSPVKVTGTLYCVITIRFGCSITKNLFIRIEIRNIRPYIDQVILFRDIINLPDKLIGRHSRKSNGVISVCRLAKPFIYEWLKFIIIVSIFGILPCSVRISHFAYPKLGTIRGLYLKNLHGSLLGLLPLLLEIQDITDDLSKINGFLKRFSSRSFTKHILVLDLVNHIIKSAALCRIAGGIIGFCDIAGNNILPFLSTGFEEKEISVSVTI